MKNGEREINHIGHVGSVEIFHRNRYLPARRAQAGRDRYRNRKYGKGDAPLIFTNPTLMGKKGE